MYTKLANTILTSTVWMESDETRIVWITMLAMADKNGEVQASIPGLANVARVRLEACREALEIFQRPDPDSRTEGDQGRRIEKIPGGWVILNHGKYRELGSDDDRRAKNAERQRRWRERHKNNATGVTPCYKSRQISHTDTDTKADTDTEEEPPPPPPPPAAPLPPKGGGKAKQIQKLWNEVADECGFRPGMLSSGRLRHINARLQEPEWVRDYPEAIAKLKNIQWVRGKNNQKWVANFGWFLRPDTVAKIMEGVYDDNKHDISISSPDDNAGNFWDA